MRMVLLIVFTIFIQVNKVLCQSGFGSVFPIPLNIINDDINFRQCPKESGAYTHTKNCSLFHMCTFGIHTIYSCIDGFFFNPTSGKCQYWPIEKEINCVNIVKQMMDTDFFSSTNAIKNYDDYHNRKSATSNCTQVGIYPDILDCSLFHYCHQNKEHEILACPNGLHFDPKIFMCSAPQLVNCQYEPPIEAIVTEDEVDDTSTIKPKTICYNYAPGTHLPVANKFDEFIICNNGGKSTLMKCKLGYNYNALTMKCEMKSCAKFSSLCKNNGKCIDESTNKNGFYCVCSIGYQGEYCEKSVELVKTTQNRIDTSTKVLLQYINRLTDDNNKSLTTMINTKNYNDPLRKPLYYKNSKNEDKINVIEKYSTSNSPLSQIINRLNNKYNQQQELDDVFKIIFAIILTLIGMIFLGSIVFSITVCIRLISTPSLETVGTWKTLTEESKV